MKIHALSDRSKNSGNQANNIIKLIVALSLVLFAGSGWGWWHYVRSNPENTFYGMLDNNLKTRGVSREVIQSSSGQSLNQTAQLNLTPQRAAQGFTSINQEGEVSASIKTENISTPTADFVRYTNIDTNQKGAQGQSLDFSGLLNIWGKTTFENPTQGSGELLTESLMGVVPVGNLNGQMRGELLQLIKDKKVYDFGTGIKREVQNGRPVYAYKVTVAPEAYVTMLKAFAANMGIKQLEAVDPASYKNSQPLVFTLKVDVWSRYLIGIEYDGAGRSEVLSGYGASRDVVLPSKSISIDALQAKLQAVQE